MDPIVDLLTGSYRFHVTGHSAVAAGVVSPYTLNSTTFAVTPYTFATLVKTTGDTTSTTYAVANPAPAPLANFRYRPRTNSAASIEGGAATVTLAAGQARTFAPGTITDPYGNTNSQTITVSGDSIEALPVQAAAAPPAPKLVCATAVSPTASVPEAPWAPGFVLLGMLVVGFTVRRARRLS